MAAEDGTWAAALLLNGSAGLDAFYRRLEDKRAHRPVPLDADFTDHARAVAATSSARIGDPCTNAVAVRTSTGPTVRTAANARRSVSPEEEISSTRSTRRPREAAGAAGWVHALHARAGRLQAKPQGRG